MGEREQLTQALYLIENTLRKLDSELPAEMQVNGLLRVQSFLNHLEMR